MNTSFLLANGPPHSATSLVDPLNPPGETSGTTQIREKRENKGKLCFGQFGFSHPINTEGVGREIFIIKKIICEISKMLSTDPLLTPLLTSYLARGDNL